MFLNFASGGLVWVEEPILKGNLHQARPRVAPVLYTLQYAPEERFTKFRVSALRGRTK